MVYQNYWVGLDAGHLETAVCLVDADGQIIFEAICETKSGPIRDILRRHGVEAVQRVTIEAGNGTQMVRELMSFGFPVQVVDVRKSSKFLAIRRQKTDVHDARGLAELGRIARTMGSSIYLKPLEHQNIRSLMNSKRPASHELRGRRWTVTPAQFSLLLEAMDWRRTVAPKPPQRPVHI